jgi:hypothetical protein
MGDHQGRPPAPPIRPTMERQQMYKDNDVSSSSFPCLVDCDFSLIYVVLSVQNTHCMASQEGASWASVIAASRSSSLNDSVADN